MKTDTCGQQSAAEILPHLEEEDAEAESEVYGSPSSMVHMVPSPPLSPPLSPTQPQQHGTPPTSVTTVTVRHVGELTSPPTLTDVGLSPIER